LLTISYAVGRILLEGLPIVHELIKFLQAEAPAHPEFGPGDTIKVHVKVVEGDRERVQIFQGIVIRYHGGSNQKMFTVRRVASHNIGVERSFMFNSPRIEKIEVVRRAKVRRAQLYYMRELRGKAARLKERR
jgi:large subunit ribosomal protein L19